MPSRGILYFPLNINPHKTGFVVLYCRTLVLSAIKGFYLWILPYGFGRSFSEEDIVSAKIQFVLISRPIFLSKVL